MFCAVGVRTAIDPRGTLPTLPHQGIISRWFHHRAWRWIIFRARWWQCIFSGVVGWWLIAWLLLLPWATIIDEPYFGNIGIWHSLTSSAVHAIQPAMVAALSLVIVPLLALLALLRDRHAARQAAPTHWPVRAWFAAPWMLIPFVALPVFWFWLGFSRSMTLDDMTTVPPDIVWKGFNTFLVPASPAALMLLGLKLAVLIGAVIITQCNWPNRLMRLYECRACTYDLSTLPKGATCPECGTPSPPWPPLEPTTRAIRPPDE
jgi:hypothetical protein